jgi:hypothetical protein
MRNKLLIISKNQNKKMNSKKHQILFVFVLISAVCSASIYQKNLVSNQNDSRISQIQNIMNSV